MRTRDLGILIISLIAIIISINQEGSISIVHSWYMEIDPTGSTYRNGNAPDPSEKLPLPIITDIDGDGENEMIVATREPAIKILKLRARSHKQRSRRTRGSEWDHVETKASASLLLNVMVKRGRQPIAMKTGYLQPLHTSSKKTITVDDSKGRASDINSNPFGAGTFSSDTSNHNDHKDNNNNDNDSIGGGGAYSRKQVVVVVTEGWHVLCFDHRLQFLWESSVDADFIDSYIGEVAINIDSHRVRDADMGMVLVGGRLQSRFDANHLGHVGVNEAVGDDNSDFDYGYGNENEGQNMFDGEGSQDSGFGQEGRGSASSGHSTDHHFSFYAFEGRTGELRWKHEAGDFQEESHASQMLYPQHDVHAGEMDWRNFRSSLLSSLPHQWTGREDTRFELAHFERRRSGKDRQEDILEQAEQADLKWHVDLVNNNGRTPHSENEHVVKPNALVAHLRDGVEILHLYTGRPLCRLSLKRDVLHADINSDGVIDHLEPVAGVYTPFSAASADQTQRRLRSQEPKCRAQATSAIPPTHQLYNGSICRDTLSSKLKSNMNAHDLNAWIREGSEGNSVKAALEDLKAAAPTILSLPSSLSSSSSVSNPFYSSTHSRPRLQSVYFTNDGLLTSFDPEGNTLWRVQTQSSWLTTQTEARDSASGNQRVMHRKKRHLNKGKMQKQEDVFLRKIHQLSMQPSATPFKVFNNVDHSRSHSRNHRGEKYLLAVGEDTLSLLDREGNVISDISVFDVPVAKPCVGDFNNDDLNDIIIITTAGYYGYTVRHRIGSALFTVLVCFLLVCLTLTFVYKMVLSLESKKDFRRRRKGRID